MSEQLNFKFKELLIAGYSIGPKEVFLTEDKEVIAFNGYVEAPKHVTEIKKSLKEIFEKSFEDGYFTFFAKDLGDPKIISLLFVTMELMNDVFDEIKELETIGAFELHDQNMIGTLDRLKRITDGMLAGKLDTSVEFFDMCYDVAYIQDLNSDEDFVEDTASFALLIFLATILKHQPSEKLEEKALVPLSEKNAMYIREDDEDPTIATLLGFYDDIIEKLDGDDLNGL